jgi:O-antigen/teichoic acid export membrane protein
LSNLTEVGIYSVGAKIASVASLVYIAFNTGWSYFSYETMNDKDQVQLISNIFRFFVVVMFITIFLSNIFVLPIFKLIFVGDYVLGAYVAPLLLSAPFVQVLIQILATQFLIQKNSKIYSIAQLIGVLVNIGLNIPLIIYFGAIGAAFATALSYLVPLSILLIVTIRQNKISIKKIEMYLFTFLMTWFYFSVLLINFDYFLQSVLMNFLGIFLVIYFYKRNILSMSKILLQILKKKGDLL